MSAKKSVTEWMIAWPLNMVWLMLQLMETTNLEIVNHKVVLLLVILMDIIRILTCMLKVTLLPKSQLLRSQHQSKSLLLKNLLSNMITLISNITL